MELYVETLYDNEEVSQIEFLEEGYRKIQGRPSIWRQMSMYAAGFKVYWLTTMVHLDNKVITFHAWRLSSGLQPLNATTRLFFENARF